VESIKAGEEEEEDEPLDWDQAQVCSIPKTFHPFKHFPGSRGTYGRNEQPSRLTSTSDIAHNLFLSPSWITNSMNSGEIVYYDRVKKHTQTLGINQLLPSRCKSSNRPNKEFTLSSRLETLFFTTSRFSLRLLSTVCTVFSSSRKALCVFFCSSSKSSSVV